MQKPKPSLAMHLTEHNGEVKLLIRDQDKTVVDFENVDAPNVRVNGFTNRAPSFQNIIDLMEREGPNYDGGAKQVLDVYITGLEKQIYKATLNLRREARKLAMLGGSLRTAKILRKTSGIG